MTIPGTAGANEHFSRGPAVISRLWHACCVQHFAVSTMQARQCSPLLRARACRLASEQSSSTIQVSQRRGFPPRVKPLLARIVLDSSPRLPLQDGRSRSVSGAATITCTLMRPTR